MAEVDAQGGIVKRVAEGAIQARVSAQAYEMQRAIECGASSARSASTATESTRPRSGKSRSTLIEKRTTRMQIESLNRVRGERDGARCRRRALGRLRADAAADRNVMPAIMDAVKAYATVGEITNELVAVYGRYRSPSGSEGRSMKRDTVLSMEQALSLPSATLRFAHLGWRVIRIEATPQSAKGLPGDPEPLHRRARRRRRPAQLFRRAQCRQGGDRAQSEGSARPAKCCAG